MIYRYMNGERTALLPTLVSPHFDTLPVFLWLSKSLLSLFVLQISICFPMGVGIILFVLDEVSLISDPFIGLSLSLSFISAFLFLFLHFFWLSLIRMVRYICRGSHQRVFTLLLSSFALFSCGDFSICFSPSHIFWGLSRLERKCLAFLRKTIPFTYLFSFLLISSLNISWICFWISSYRHLSCQFEHSVSLGLFQVRNFAISRSLWNGPH